MADRIKIRRLEGVEDAAQVEEVQRAVWPGSETEVVPAHAMLAIGENGGVLIGAFDGDRLVGYVLGFLGTDSKSPERPAMARLKHCSHMLGVHPDFRDKNIGYRLKCAQREAVVEQGIRLITWTYDPLLSRNAQLNIRRLGAVCNTYKRNIYGELRDGINIGLPTDRFEVEWWVTSARVVSRLNEARPPLDLANFLGAGAQKINPPTYDENDLPTPAATPSQLEAPLLLVEIPSDFLVVKQQDRELALAWRLHTRELFEQAFAQGYLVVDFIYLKRERRPRSYYLMVHGERTLG
ncbi:MAG: GNAT family N-acetyltransferase [Anaerolineales bacterium]|jgi:predicted GNAT superfamily acetyltransferase